MIASNWSRWVIYGMAALIVLGSLGYSDYLAQELASKEKARIELYRDGLTFSVNPEVDNVCLSFVFSKLVQDSVNEIPQILVDDKGEVLSVNHLGLPKDLSVKDSLSRVQSKLESFKAGYEPIEVNFGPEQYNYVYYGESKLLRQLRWFPYIQLTVVLMFIAVVFYGFAVAKRNEQNRVWVGLAKETAHQLGTPVSSLMAWIELLRLKSEDNPDEQELIFEMERDVKRLEIIAERFSKIGSKPDLVAVPLGEVFDHSTEYLQKRMTQRGSIRVEVASDLPRDKPIMINSQLFDWVIENLMKNALDAMDGQSGLIRVTAGEKGNFYFIDVEDTGKGIPKANVKKIFEPGFTTKKRGWGLGLSLTKRIVENYHRGKIFVKESEVNKGTTFRVLLPKG
ncbi:MAG: HAMP domain-containing histidine kinase [Bacteroidia bacterium]|nr:HAMP domain-containing histidine kinase [Bacteroidia bacterium]